MRAGRGDPYRAANPPSQRPCPRCLAPLLRPDWIGEIAVDRCNRCDGLWVPKPVFRRVCEDIDLQSQVVALLGPGEPVAEPRVVYLRCPRCSGPMARTNFGRRSGVIVDSCPAHGIWFDPGELVAAIEFLIRRSTPAEPGAGPSKDADRPRPAPLLLDSTEPPATRWLTVAVEAIADLLFWP